MSDQPTGAGWNQDMHRRTFLAAAAVAACATQLLSQVTGTPRALADPDALAAHPRLLVTDGFAGAAALVASDDRAAGWYARIRAAADAMLTAPVARYLIPDGLRLLDTSRETVHRVYTLGFAYGIDGERAHLDRLWSELEAVCAFPDWNHQRHFLDTAEMTHAVALGLDWFFDEWTPEQRAVLINAIRTHGLERGLAVYENGGQGAGGDWPTATHNWNLVCNGGLVVGALAVADEHAELTAAVLEHAIASVPTAIHEYGPDGGYPEGLGSYWGYATKYLVLLIEALRTATGDERGLAASDGIDTTGDFPLQLTGPTALNFNYYDAGSAAPRTPEMFWLARRYGRPEYAWWGALGADLAAPSWVQSPMGLLWYDPASTAGPVVAGTARDAYFGRCEVATMRSGWESTTAVFVGGKAGDNATNHGDLDLGDFVLDALGLRWVVQLGPEDYNLPGYWEGSAGGQRWSYYRKRGEGQNTVVVDPGRGEDQVATAKGRIVRRDAGPTESYAIAELGEASPRLASWRRGWRLFDRRRQLMITDELAAADDPVETWWALHTTAEVELSADGRTATLQRPGRSVAARIVEPAGATFLIGDATPLWTSPAPAGQNPNTGIRKLMVRLTDVTRARLSVQFSPLHDGEAVPVTVRPTALDAWTVDGRAIARLASIEVDGEPVIGFSPDHLVADHDLPEGASVRLRTVDPAGRAVLRARAADGSRTVVVTAPRQLRSEYVFWPVAGRRPGVWSSSVVASTDDGNVAANTLDGRLDTRWSAEGSGEWLGFDLGEDGPLGTLRIAWYLGDRRRSRYRIEVASAPDQVWRVVATGESSGTTAGLEAVPLSGVSARFVRIVGLGNSESAWNSVAEVEFGDRQVAPPASAGQLVGLTLEVPMVGVGADVAVTVGGRAADGSAVDPVGPVELVSSDPRVLAVVDGDRVRGAAEGSAELAAVLVTGERRLVHTRTTVVVSDPDLLRLPATADTWVNDGSRADQTFGSGATLLVKTVAAPDSGFTRVGYVRFEPQATSRTVDAVTLRLWCRVSDSESDTAVVDVLSAEGTIDERTTTWNTRPTTGSRLGGVTVTAEGWYDIPLGTALAETVRAGRPVLVALSQLLPAGANGYAVDVSARESARGPQLIVALSD